MKRFTRKLLPKITCMVADGGTYNSIAFALGVMPATLKKWERRHKDVFDVLAPAHSRDLIAKLDGHKMKNEPKPTNEHTSTNANKRKRRKYDPSLCSTVRELGRKGHSILEVAEITGIAHSTLCGYEKRIPAFREAFAGVRKASEYRKKLRLQKLLQKDEMRLVIALGRARARTANEKRELDEMLSRL